MMSQSSSRAVPAPPKPSPAPFEAKRFDFSNVQGLSERALELHRTLYEGYVKEANALLPFVYAEGKEASTEARLRDDGLVRRFAFEHNGMVLHELFFESLRGRSSPPAANGAFSRAVEESFGGFEAWQNDVRRLAQTRGVGWVITTQSARGHRLYNIWIDGHSDGLLADRRPVAVFDIWEHAFLIDFKPSERLSYLTTLFDNMDWKIIESRCV